MQCRKQKINVLNSRNKNSNRSIRKTNQWKKCIKIYEHSNDRKEMKWAINIEKMHSLKNFICKMQSKRIVIIINNHFTNITLAQISNVTVPRGWWGCWHWHFHMLCIGEGLGSKPKGLCHALSCKMCYSNSVKD